jgi:hypothetical protein
VADAGLWPGTLAAALLLGAVPVASGEGAELPDDDFLLFLADWDELVLDAETLQAQATDEGSAAGEPSGEEDDDHD